MSGFGIWTTKIDPIEKENSKTKFIKSHGKSSVWKEDHENS